MKNLEYDEQTKVLLHTIMRAIDNIDKDKRAYNESHDREMKILLLARQQLLDLVILKNKENGHGYVDNY